MFDFLKTETKYYAKRTFTYYIPSPPLRKTGYQEKEFDSVIEYIVSLGFELLDFKIATHSGEGKSGAWILCVLAAQTEEIFKQVIDFQPNDSSEGADSSSHHIQLDPDIIHDS